MPPLGTRSAPVLSHVVVLALWALLWGQTPLNAQAPSTDELLSRAATYVEDFVARFSNVIAEERTIQETLDDRRTRELVSDYLIVQLPGTNEWISFRDVFQVDDEQVRDPDERLVRLFLEQPSASTLERATAIAQEGVRYNLVDTGTLANPVLVLALAQPQYRDLFRWSDAGRDQEVGPDVWELQFEETGRGALLSAQAPATGSVWIDATTGQILKTELWLDMGRRVVSSGPVAGASRSARSSTFGTLTAQLGTRVTTWFAFDERFGIAVPVELHESYSRFPVEVRTETTYGRFRSFVDENSEISESTPASR